MFRFDFGFLLLQNLLIAVLRSHMYESFFHHIILFAVDKIT